MRGLAKWTLICVFAMLPASQAMTDPASETYDSLVAFMESTRPGQLGIALDVTGEKKLLGTKKVLALQDGSETALYRDRGGQLRFVVNHKSAADQDENSYQENGSFIAIKMRVRYSRLGIGSTLYLYRNKGWTRWARNWPREFLKRRVKETVKVDLYGKSTSEFAKLHQGNDLDAVDRFMDNHAFHAAPKGSEVNSWSNSKEFWSGEGGLCEEGEKTCTMKAYLLAFTEGSDSRADKIPNFSSTSWDVDTMEIWTFSPADERYAGHYVIRFVDQ